MISVSEVASIRQTIAAEYMAASWGFSGLAAGTARHAFISARMERMEEGRKRLETMVGEQAITLVAETLETISERPARHHIHALLLHELGDTEETAHLLDWIADMWETYDELLKRFNAEFVHKVIYAAHAPVDSQIC